MGRFNLLDEPWISVVTDQDGNTKEVSLKNLFENAHLYKELAGDMETQDFAVLRILLAVLHTVFSRFDANGEEYGDWELDDRFKPKDVGEDEIEIDEMERQEMLYDTWISLWRKGQFPPIVGEYLEKWRDRFYLFDEQYPFFQVRKQDISGNKINKAQASSVSGKNINRLISESENKIALFSPRYETQSNKEKLTAAEIARWLITFQGYTGLSDKVIFGKEKYKSSKGWLFDLGAIYLKGENLFQTLLLNCALPDDRNILQIQKPCWEVNGDTVIKNCFPFNSPDNLAGLYTAWSRGIYINPDIDLLSPFVFDIVKLPDIEHQDNFLEPMTLWRYNESGENKGAYTPRKHQANKAIWRSFGLITLSSPENNQRVPGIMDWLDIIKDEVGNTGIIICATSMQDDGNATSWVPTDEITDYLCINNFVLTDLQEDGWLVRINEVVEKTKKVVEVTYKKYIANIKEIRNISSGLFLEQKIEELYFKIDGPFRRWLFSITLEDEKDKKVTEWQIILKKLVREQAGEILYSGNGRDYLGIVKDGNLKNIATAYNSFIHFLNRELKVEEAENANIGKCS